MHMTISSGLMMMEMRLTLHRKSVKISIAQTALLLLRLKALLIKLVKVLIAQTVLL